MKNVETRLTDETVRKAFDQVYNGFWRRWNRNIRGLDSSTDQEWDRIVDQMSELGKNYPFFRPVILELFNELERRGRDKEAQKT